MRLKEWLGENNLIGQDIWKRKYQENDESLEDWFDRVSNKNEELKKLIKEKKFLFGGRVLSNRLVPNGGSYFNCYSAGFAEDDYEALLELNKIIGITYKNEGGQGISLSKLRPKGTKIRGRYESDGIIPFMEIFNTTTEATSQGGSRKGALMISLDIKHAEALSFIKVKSNTNKITKANLSLEIDDEFMRAVQVFYETGKREILTEVRKYGNNTVIYEIDPVFLYQEMVKNCYDWGEPGCLFTERFRNYSLMEKIETYNIETSNPCSEQPLPKHFSCNLGSINLNEFVINPFTKEAKIDFKELKRTIEIAIEGLDELIDENADRHPLEIQKTNSLNYRNVGLGVMGYANMLMKMELIYGSEEALALTELLFKTIFKDAVKASSNIAKKKGVFRKYDSRMFDSEIIKKHFIKSEIEELKKVGMRNCSLLSVAPTGSISSMISVSGGIEPEYALYYERTANLTQGKEEKYKIFVSSVKEYFKQTGKNKEKQMPKYFVSSKDIPWKDRVKTQSVIQNSIDTAISSTVNLPEFIEIEEVEKLYLEAWKQGLKGITVFRDGCKRLGILSTKENEDEFKSVDFIEEGALEWGDTLSCSDKLIGLKRKIITGCGSLHVLAFYDWGGRLQELFFNKGSKGGCHSFMNGLSRTMSLAARTGASLEKIVDQLSSVPGCTAYTNRTVTEKDTDPGKNCPNAIGNALMSIQREIDSILNIRKATPTKFKVREVEAPAIDEKKIHMICPVCIKRDIRTILSAKMGCFSCDNCGYQKCD